MSTASRISARAAQLVLLAGMTPAVAVDTAAAQIPAAPAAVRLAHATVARASKDLLRVLAGGAR